MAQSGTAFSGPRVMVTGTDTDVGKTFVSAALLKVWQGLGINVGAYKPAVSGCEFNSVGQPVWNDVEVLYEALGQRFPRERVCPQSFSAPLAPPFAAEVEQRLINDRLLIDGASWWENQVDLLLVEGAGGLLSPLSSTGSNADLASELDLPLIIVARLGLGTINHTLLTVEAAERRGLQILGIVLNDGQGGEKDESRHSNPRHLAARCKPPILAVLPHLLCSDDLLEYQPFLKMAEHLRSRLFETHP